ncbi:MAG TPA: hypothetical protein VFU22_20675 [Roseiflexaceae bacterium]|nr:hypothetical protein [Roseiflexaceae bacterium]
MSTTPNEPTDHQMLVESWKAYFVTEYQRDARNARRQTFDDYWGWVKTFLLLGGSGYPGWLAQTAAALAGVRDEAASRRLGGRAAELGKRIAGEWSKDSAYRRIFSNPFQGRPNLLDWGRAIQRAARAERGDGGALEAALDRIERELEGALRG